MPRRACAGCCRGNTDGRGGGRGVRLLVIWAIVSIPYTIFGIYTGDKYWSPGNILAFVISGAVLAHLFAFQRKVAWQAVWWHKYFLLFMLCGLASTLSSPYFSAALARAMFQFTGILNMICLCLALASEIRRDPAFLPTLTRYAMIGLGVVAVLGIVQFFTFNFLRTDAGFAQLLIFNDLAGGYVYKLPSELGTIMRPNSICREPSHLAQFLGMGAGVSLIRLGVLGKGMKADIAAAVPKWTAVSTLICFALTISVIGYLLLALVMVFLVAMSRRFSWTFIARGAAFALIAMAGMAAMAKFAGPKFATKVGSIRFFFSQVDAKEIKDEYVSALAITANIDVMVQNLRARPLLGVGLGAHPASYIEKAPQYIRRPDMYRINAADAGGLLFRLLSETGLAGTACYLAGLAAIILKARGAVLGAVPFREDTPPLLIGYTASLAAVALIFFFRWGSYYDIELWALMALSACAPMLFHPRGAAAPSPGLARAETAGAGLGLA